MLSFSTAQFQESSWRSAYHAVFRLSPLSSDLAVLNSERGLPYVSKWFLGGSVIDRTQLWDPDALVGTELAEVSRTLSQPCQYPDT